MVKAAAAADVTAVRANAEAKINKRRTLQDAVIIDNLKDPSRFDRLGFYNPQKKVGFGERNMTFFHINCQSKS